MGMMDKKMEATLGFMLLGVSLLGLRIKALRVFGSGFWGFGFFRLWGFVGHTLHPKLLKPFRALALKAFQFQLGLRVVPLGRR